MTDENRRVFFRLKLQLPLRSQLKVIDAEQERLRRKSVGVLITDISAGGIRIHSRLDMPLNYSPLLEFSFCLFDKEIVRLGTIVRKTQLNGRLYEYGIRFFLDEQESSLLLASLNLLSVRLKKQVPLASCSFCSEEEILQFYESDYDFSTS